MSVAGCCVEDKAATDVGVVTVLVRFGTTTVLAPVFNVVSKTQVRAADWCKQRFIQIIKPTTPHEQIHVHKVGIVIARARTGPSIPVIINLHKHNYRPYTTTCTCTPLLFITVVSAVINIVTYTVFIYASSIVASKKASRLAGCTRSCI